jgi:hypothetical protein
MTDDGQLAVDSLVPPPAAESEDPAPVAATKAPDPPAPEPADTETASVEPAPTLPAEEPRADEEPAEEAPAEEAPVVVQPAPARGRHASDETREQPAIKVARPPAHQKPEPSTEPATGRRTGWTVPQTLLALFLIVAIAVGAAVVTWPHGAGQVTATWFDGVVPSAAPKPTVAPTGPPIAVPAGGLDLANATLDLPALPQNFLACQGQVSLVDNVGYAAGTDPKSAPGDPATVFALHVTREWLGDVNRDGTPDTLAQVTCGNADTSLWQLVALTPGTAGAPQTIGQVVASGPAPAPASLFDVVVADGTVQAEVGDLALADPSVVDQLSTHQQRSYKWNGHVFTQVAGSRSFPANPNFYDLSVTTSPLRFGAASGGRRSGVLTVNVRNRGTGSAYQSQVSITMPATFSLTGPVSATQTCHSAPDPAGQVLTCDLDTMAGGASRTLYLTLSDPDSDSADPAPASRLVTVHGTDRYNLGLSLDQSSDNDQAPYPVTRA